MEQFDRDIYRPVLLAVEGVITTHLPLLSGIVTSALADRILDAVCDVGALNLQPEQCEAQPWCREDAIWGTRVCPAHTEDEDG